MMDENQTINNWFHEKLKNVLPDVYSKLTLAVYSREHIGDEWNLEIGSEEGENYTEVLSSETQLYPDSRTGQWGRKKQLLWKVYAAYGMRESALLENFLNAFLKSLMQNFIDCKMFSEFRADNAAVFGHLFSEAKNWENFLQTYIDAVLKEKRLPDKAVITQISAQMYERRPLCGNMLFVPEEIWQGLQKDIMTAQEMVLNLEYISLEQRTLTMENMRIIRKLLEINTEDTYMIATLNPGSALRGIATKKEVENLKDNVCIGFNGYLKWKMKVGEEQWFSCDNGTYTLCLEDDLREQCQQKLNCLNLDKEEKIIGIITRLTNEKHGTSVIFMDKKAAAREVERLNGMNRCIKLSKTVEKQKRKKEIGIDLDSYLNKMKGITAIDGALLADLSGELYAIGCILDGEAVKPGKVSRGARYNSVMNYLYVLKTKKKHKNICAFGAIISEDETVDIVIPG